jgi:LacI family transcriptional regulator
MKSDLAITIHDVARDCGLSPTTVSRALNGKHVQYRISAETRARALKAAERLGFQANWKAKTLGDRRSFQIGMLFRHAFPEFRGVFEELLRELNGGLERAGYHLLFVPVHGDRGLALIREQRLDGLVLADPLSGEIISLLDAIGAPAVVLNNLAPSDRYGQVVPDDAQGVDLAVEHLVSLGHRRIAYFRMGRGSVAAHFSVALRRESFVASMQRRGLGDSAVVADEPVDAFLSRVPIGPGGCTAIITYTHTEVVHLLRSLSQRGVRVPHDVSIVAFNNTFPMDSMFPSITVVDVPAGQMGKLGAEMLLEQLNNPSEARPRHVTLPESLIVRESTGPAPQS